MCPNRIFSDAPSGVDCLSGNGSIRGETCPSDNGDDTDRSGGGGGIVGKRGFPGGAIRADVGLFDGLNVDSADGRCSVLLLLVDSTRPSIEKEESDELEG